MPKQPDHADFDAARRELIRQRVVILAIVVASLLVALSIMAESVLRQANRPTRLLGAAPAIGAAAMLTFGVFKLRNRRATMSLRELVVRSTMIVVVSIVLQIPAAKLVASALSDLLRRAGLEHVQIGALVPLFVSLLVIHTAASLIVPWSMWESARPVLIIAFFALLAAPFAPDPWPARFGGIVGLIVMGFPGMIICWLRFSRFREKFQLHFFTARYTEVQRELETARRIHEKFFPARISSGPVLFDYRYEPMQQIGGDFVDVTRREEGITGITLVDITGHGIAAALAVNRLHGEVKRTLAVEKKRGPASVMTALNDYMHLTLADESVFGTALAATVDPLSRTITWVNAGHPPAFLCRDDGSIETLDSTAMMLGILPASDFDPDPQTRDFNAGDVLIVYTDGGIECRGRDDSQLGIEGLRQFVEASRDDSISRTLDAIMARIANFRVGPPDDDTLIVAVKFSTETSA